MKKKYLLLFFVALAFLFGGIAKSEAISCLSPQQGGTGLCQATSSNVGQVIGVTSVSAASIPTLGYVTASGGSGGTTTTINGVNGPSFTFLATSSATTLSYSTSSGTVTLTIPKSISFFTNDSGYLTGNQTITLTGAVTGSGATTIATAFSTSTLFALFSGTNPITFSASTGVIACPTCSTATAANPTAQIGVSAVNGSASTFMRSDAAPAINQAATFSFSALGNTTSTGNIAVSTINASTSITNQGVKSALVLNSSAGLETTYGGSSNPCSANAAPTTLSAVGALGGCTSAFLTTALTSINSMTGPAITVVGTSPVTVASSTNTLTIACPTCLTSASAVASVNSIVGAVNIVGTANRVIVSSSSQTITLSAPQDLATSSAVTFNGITNNGNETISGTLGVTGISTFASTTATQATTTRLSVTSLSAGLVTSNSIGSVSSLAPAATGTFAMSNGTTWSTSTPFNYWTADTGPYATAAISMCTTGHACIFGPVSLPYAVTATKMVFQITTADNSSDIYDIGLYDQNGNLVANVGHQSFTTTGVKDIAFANGTTTIAPTNLFIGISGNSTTLKFEGVTSWEPMGGTTGNVTTTPGNLPATTTLGTPAPTTVGGRPWFAVHI